MRVCESSDLSMSVISNSSSKDSTVQKHGVRAAGAATSVRWRHTFKLLSSASSALYLVCNCRFDVPEARLLVTRRHALQLRVNGQLTMLEITHDCCLFRCRWRGVGLLCSSMI